MKPRNHRARRRRRQRQVRSGRRAAQPAGITTTTAAGRRNLHQVAGLKIETGVNPGRRSRNHESGILSERWQSQDQRNGHEENRQEAGVARQVKVAKKHRLPSKKRFYIENRSLAPRLTYSPALAANVPTTAMFGSRSAGKPCLSFRYSGLLYESHTLPWPSFQTKIFKGRSMATLGAANMRGVPPLGLPKINSLVGGIFIPTFSASPLWSIKANRVTPLDARIFLSRSTVSS